MFEYNKKTNLLESTGQAYPLEDVREPNLYRDFFSYEDIQGLYLTDDWCQWTCLNIFG